MPKIVDIDERRAELAAAAAQLIARVGVGAVTLREVAAEAGWTTGVLTHYFADKRELLLFTFRSSMARRAATRGTRAARSPLEALVQSVERALVVDEDSRRHWMVMIACSAQAAGDRELADAQRDAYREFRGRVTELVERSGIAGEEEAMAVAERLIAVADGIAVQALFDPASWPARRQVVALHAIIDPILAG